MDYLAIRVQERNNFFRQIQNCDGVFRSPDVILLAIDFGLHDENKCFDQIRYMRKRTNLTTITKNRDGLVAQGRLYEAWENESSLTSLIRSYGIERTDKI